MVHVQVGTSYEVSQVAKDPESGYTNRERLSWRATVDSRYVRGFIHHPSYGSRFFSGYMLDIRSQKLGRKSLDDVLDILSDVVGTWRCE
jgi:hypothetical protein